MKLSTGHCIKFLATAMPFLSEDGWKRRSKKKVGPAIARFFEHSSGTKVVVFEQDGKLSYCDGWEPSDMKPGDGWLFAVVDRKEMAGGFIVMTTERGYWKTQHCVDDQSPSQHIQDVLHGVGLCECMESCFEPDEGSTKEEVKQRLEALGFVNDPDFQDFCAGNEGDDDEEDDEDSDTDEPDLERPGMMFLGSELSQESIEAAKAKILSMPMDDLRRAMKKANRDDGFEGYSDNEIRTFQVDSLHEDYTYVVEFMHALGVEIFATVEWKNLTTKERVVEKWPWMKLYPNWKWGC